MTDFSSTPVLSFDRVRLEPLTTAHEAGLREAVCDGEVWKLNVTTAPEPHQVADYIRTAIQTRLAFAVIDEDTGKLLARLRFTTSTPPSHASTSVSHGMPCRHGARASIPPAKSCCSTTFSTL